MVVDQEYYNTLNVSVDASEKEIKNAYRKMAMAHHPDKGGDEQKFKDVTAAYEVLSNKEKRDMYDKFGKDGPECQHAGMNPHDIFSHVFGNSGFGNFGFNMGHDNRTTQDIHTHFELAVSLEELFTGIEKKIQIKRKILTDKSKLKKEKCRLCDGTGRIVNIVQRGPFTQSQISACVKCNQGYVFSGGVAESADIITVKIEKGTKHGKQYRFHQKADYIPSLDITSDLIVVIKEKEHHMYQRHNMDLVIKLTINVLNIITETPVLYSHIDGRKYGLDVSNIKRFDDYYCVKHMGMCESEYVTGDLIIHFTPIVDISTQNKAACKKLLEVEQIGDEVTIKNVCMYKKEQNSDGQRQSNVQCAQQ